MSKDLRNIANCWPRAVLVLLAGAAAALADGGKVDFVRDIRPIFEKHCYDCHGPTKAEGGVRWDRRQMAFLPADSGHPPVVAGDPAKSELLHVLSPEAKVRMPFDRDPLPADTVELLRRWIEQGADWPDGIDPEYEPQHWSFRKPVRPEPPAVKQADWPRNAIDRFILAKLEAAGLKPSPEADRHDLIRRLSIDLTGLPPTPAEVAAFVHDTAPDAYERLVDRLLASPAYGERWARVWLDLARYADSRGFGSDPLRLNIWPYRDWLINALNRNQPFDQFTIDQLAGDLLDNPTPDQLVATAFHRNTLTNTEGGTDDEEFRVAAVKDRVNTTMQVWMGLTMGCAQCHSHKYDPITQRDYYRFYAIFNQTADSDRADEFPTMPLYRGSDEQRREQLQAQIAELKKQLEPAADGPEARQLAWEKQLREKAGEWRPVTIASAKATKSAAKLDVQDDGSVLASGDRAKTDTYLVEAAADVPAITAVRLEVLPHESLGGNGPGRSGNFVLNEISLVVRAGQSEQAAKFVHAVADYSQQSFDVAEAIDGDAGKESGWAVAGATGKPHTAVFTLRDPLKIPPGATLRFKLEQNYPNHAIGRFRLAVTGAPADIAAVPPHVRELVAIAPADRKPEQSREIAGFFAAIDPHRRPHREKLAALEREFEAIKPTPLPVMRELEPGKRRATHVLIKGNFTSPGELVTPAIPEAFGPLPDGEAPTRLGVARWLIHPDNPLTARVQVNRYWSVLFGRGLVMTEEDFGTQGSPPTHPQLLDWLATEYIRLGWDTKAIIRLIVTSATYRQSSRVTPELLAADPANELYSRSPRLRLEAEQIRDQALALSGLLSKKIGGPSVFPPQPPGLWQAAFNGERDYPTSKGEDRYRRGIYVVLRRTVPYPSLATFDAPSRDFCAIRRIPTNTPLQAFVTLNDPVYVEAAQALARRIMTEGGKTTDARIGWALRLCTAREPDARQLEILKKLYESELAHYRAEPSMAQRMATDPLGPLPGDIDAAEAAAWTVVANVLLNLDAVITRS